MPELKKNPPAYLFALGHQGVPQTLTVDGTSWRFVQLFKHDFFAATALYEQSDSPASPPRLAVLKVQRTRHFLGLPLCWLGRFIAHHEIRIYLTLQDIPGIPAFLGRYGTTGFLHAFIPGRELEPEMPFTPVFFDQLQALLAALHSRDVAYVDTNKRENILFGDDGRPWLIDFQISWFSPHWLRKTWFNRYMLRRLIRADWYHFYKHKTRLMPEQCTPEDFAKASQRGILHNLHRKIARPLIDVRRKFLSRYKLEKVK